MKTRNSVNEVYIYFNVFCSISLSIGSLNKVSAPSLVYIPIFLQRKMSSSKTALPIIFGAMTFGREGEEMVRTSSLSDCAAILDTFQSYGHGEIDTSRFYGDGSSEEYLGALKWKERGLIMDTKFFPNVPRFFGRPETHLTAKDMRKAIGESLSALGTAAVDLWYLHAPDRTVPLSETLQVVNELFKEGKFKSWGLSNFMAWEGMFMNSFLVREQY